MPKPCRSKKHDREITGEASGGRCRACMREQYRKRVIRDPECSRRTYLARKYGLTPADYAKLLHEQLGVCAICQSPPLPGRALCVDHAHATNVVRGLLCDACNKALGQADAVEAWLDKARNYLKDIAQEMS